MSARDASRPCSLDRFSPKVRLCVNFFLAAFLHLTPLRIASEPTTRPSSGMAKETGKAQAVKVVCRLRPRLPCDGESEAGNGVVEVRDEREVVISGWLSS